MAKIPCHMRLQQGINARNIKQADLCKMTGINKSTMSQYFSGLYEPSQVKIELIARALNVNEAWIMGYDVPMEREQPIAASGDGLSELKRSVIEKIKTMDDVQIDALNRLVDSILDLREK